MTNRHESRTRIAQVTEMIATESPKVDAKRAAVFTTEAGNGNLRSVLGGAQLRIFFDCAKTRFGPTRRHTLETNCADPS